MVQVSLFIFVNKSNSKCTLTDQSGAYSEIPTSGQSKRCRDLGDYKVDLADGKPVELLSVSLDSL